MYSRPWQSKLQPGDSIKGYYTIIKRLGSGSFGDVFHARYQHNSVTKDLALKLEPSNSEKNYLSAEVRILKEMAGLSLSVSLTASYLSVRLSKFSKVLYPWCNARIPIYCNGASRT